MKSINIIKLILVTLIFFNFATISFSESSPRIAVMDITSTAYGYTWKYDSNISKFATQLIIDALNKTNYFRVFEKTKMDSILQKKKSQYYCNLFDPSNATRLGKLIGVDLVVIAKVCSVRFIPSYLLNFPQEKKCRVDMIIKIIDVNKGKIIYSTIQSEVSPQYSYEKTRAILSLVNIIGDRVISDFVDKLDKKEIKISSFYLKGYILKVVSASSGGITQVYINLGANSGIKVGEEIRIYREGEVILDPKTNEILDRELDLIAQAKVMKVKDKLSIAMVTTKFRNIPIQQLDIVEVMR